MKPTVLIVDDSLFMRAAIKQGLVNGGYEVVGEAGTGEEAIELALELEPDVITLDNILPDMIGIDVLRILKEEGMDETKIMMVSAVGQQNVITEGMELGAADYLIKPFTSDTLLEKLNAVMNPVGDDIAQ